MNGRSSFKRKNSSNEEEDIISKLPEALLHHILSSLEIKEAVRTSILSKRWQYVWTSIPSLIFEIPAEEETSSFMSFVDRALILRDSSLKRFSLNCYDINLRRVRKWINAIVRCNVEELKLSFSYSYLEAFKFPPCFFTAAVWLSTLSISGPLSLKFPPSICLSSLKYLSFLDIIFADAESIQNFVSGCPVLETMSLLDCNWQQHVESVCICCPKLLWKLEISEDLDHLSNTITSGSCDVMISGPSLKYFCFKGHFLKDYCLYDVPSLDEGVIEFQECFFAVESYRTRLYKMLKSLSHVKKLHKMLKSLSHVKKLRLSSHAMEGLSCVRNVPSFNNLVSFISGRRELECEGLAKILQSSPCLETLCFQKGLVLSSNRKKDQGGVLEPMPPCFLSHLKRIEIKFDSLHLNKNESVFDAVEILLKGAPMLEKLIVYLPKGSEDSSDSISNSDSDSDDYDDVANASASAGVGVGGDFDEDDVADASAGVGGDFDDDDDVAYVSFLVDEEYFLNKEALIRRVRKLRRASGVCQIEFVFVVKD